MGFGHLRRFFSADQKKQMIAVEGKSSREARADDSLCGWAGLIYCSNLIARITLVRDQRPKVRGRLFDYYLINGWLCCYDKQRVDPWAKGPRLYYFLAWFGVWIALILINTWTNVEMEIRVNRVVDKKAGGRREQYRI